jgi:hypothetical protein
MAYSCFLALMLPGVATLIALSIGRMGFHPQSIAAYYRGGANEMSFPKPFWQLVETSHFHLFSIPIVVLILAHLLYATPISTWLRVGLTLATFAGALLEIGGPWAVRYWAGAFSWALIAGWLLLCGGMLSMVLISLASMWGPERWNLWLTDSRPESEAPRNEA